VKQLVKIRKPSVRVLRRTLTALALTLALVGAGLIVYPFATDMWAARLQRGLVHELAGNAKAYAAGEIKTGEALTQLEIPSLGVDVVVVEGATPAALHAGAGHYPETPLPGEPGNVAIAGHRTTYGRPFNDIDKLEPGDKVILTTPVGRHTYEVLERPSVVEPTDWSPIVDFPEKGSFLTLTSCHPEGSASYRIVVHAQLVKSSDIVDRTVSDA
jgi:sortase A